MLKIGLNFSLPATSHIPALLDFRSWSQLRNDFNSKIFQIYSNNYFIIVAICSAAVQCCTSSNVDHCPYPIF